MGNKKDRKEKQPIITSGFLANFFYWLYEVAQAADRPISLLVMVSLPLISPLLPALLTAKSLQEFMGLEQHEVVIAVVSFEFIGYLGMIATVGALMKMTDYKGDDKEARKQLRFNFYFYITAYAVYLLTLLVSNGVLEYKNGSSWERVVVILCLTVGLSISAGILNASRLYDRDLKDDAEKSAQRQQDYRLKRLAIREGQAATVFNSSVQSVANGATDATNVVRDTRFSGDWRTDEGLLTKKDLMWLKGARTIDIRTKYGISARTAQRWRDKAKERLNA